MFQYPMSSPQRTTMLGFFAGAFISTSRPTYEALRPGCNSEHDPIVERRGARVITNLMASKIEDYGLIGNTQTAALISAEGSVDWLCAPRFDSDACFAALIGYDE